MAYRVFRSSDGRTWRAWTVVPICSERRLSPSWAWPADGERRHRKSTRAKLGPRWAHGWLAFETSGEKRRLSPYPANWERAADDELATLCEKATLVDSPRLRSE